MDVDKKNSVLIVDDDSSVLLELNEILKSEYKIHAVKDGMSALEKANEYAPDLILLDVVMPDMNGFDVFAELRRSEKTKEIPIIFITGDRKEGSKRKGMAIGAADYIRKPFSAVDVKIRVSQQIRIVNFLRDS